MAAWSVATLDVTRRARLVDRFGPQVAGWRDDLPDLVDAVSAASRLRVMRAMPAGGTSVLFECVTRGRVSVVLKLTPDRSIAGGEAAGLRAWADSPSGVELLDADLERGECWSGSRRVCRCQRTRKGGRCPTSLLC